MVNQGYMNPGERYGIWGVNPYGPTIKQTPGIDTAMQTAQGINSLFAQRYANQLASAKAQLAQGTLGSSIDAANTKNQADIQNYPLQQMFKTQQDEQTVKEIMARTGLSYAQAQQALAGAGAENARAGLLNAQTQEVTNPLYKTDQLIQQYMSLPDGSPQKIAAGRSLYPVFAGGMAPPLTGAGQTGKASTGLVPNIAPASPAGGMQINPLQGGSRSGYHQAATTDASGNPVTIESPTMNSASRNQMRKEAESESGYIAPTVLQGINNYQGAFPTLALAKDAIIARGTGPQAQAAAQRLQQYAIASRFVPELTAINARQATGQAPGIEVMREFKNSMFPGMPSNFANSLIPANIKVNAANAYPQLQQELASQAINQERQGYQQQGAPDWAAASNSGAPDNLAALLQGKNPAHWDAQQQAQQQQPQFDPAQVSSWAQEAIAKGADPAKVQERLRQMQRGR